MQFVITLLLAYITNINHVLTTNENIQNGEISNSTEKRDGDFLETHTFVALIDIVFTDNSKRTCTGSIIHDNVVITAAHCFITETNRDIKPELTASFVVIGSKKMFETGYEQYLPIERILIHPQFRGWTADLSLVYTFAGMTSDKPGSVIRIVANKTPANGDFNLTVLSWGHMRDKINNNRWVPTGIGNNYDETPSLESLSCEDSNEEEENNKYRVTANLLQPKLQKRPNKQMEGVTAISLRYRKGNKFQKQKQSFNNSVRALNGMGQKTLNKHLGSHRATEHKTKLISRYLSEGEETKSRKIFSISKDSHSAITYPGSSLQSYYKNWRRQMGVLDNKLSVDIVGIANIKVCKKLAAKALPKRYDISNSNDVVCYASENRFLSDEDSGAPAVYNSQLIAVTVGGVEYDGEEVAVGVKIACFCSWITENLPNGGRNFTCCNDCCDMRQDDV